MSTSCAEKRRHPRIDTANLVGYILYNKQRQKIDQGKGRTLNLSQSGVLLETKKPLQGAFVVLVTMDLDGKKVKVKGRVANTRLSPETNCYLTGVEFIGPRTEQLDAIVAFVKAYHRRKHAIQNNTAPTAEPPYSN